MTFQIKEIIITPIDYPMYFLSHSKLFLDVSHKVAILLLQSSTMIFFKVIIISVTVLKPTL